MLDGEQPSSRKAVERAAGFHKFGPSVVCMGTPALPDGSREPRALERLGVEEVHDSVVSAAGCDRACAHEHPARDRPRRVSR